MTPLVVARLALLLAGIALFLIGIRTGQDPYRYVAIGLLAVAVLLRFVDRARARRDEARIEEARRDDDERRP